MASWANLWLLKEGHGKTARSLKLAMSLELANEPKVASRKLLEPIQWFLNRNEECYLRHQEWVLMREIRYQPVEILCNECEQKCTSIMPIDHDWPTTKRRRQPRRFIACMREYTGSG